MDEPPKPPKKPDNDLSMPLMPPAPAPPRRPALQGKAVSVLEPAEDSGEKFPPLFIRIDRYKELIQNLQRLKAYALSLRDAMDALSDIEKELKTGIELTHRALDDFNTIIAVLDAKLLRLSGMEETIEGESPEHMDDYIRGVYDQIAKIKDELRTISS